MRGAWRQVRCVAAGTASSGVRAAAVAEGSCGPESPRTCRCSGESALEVHAGEGDRVAARGSGLGGGHAAAGRGEGGGEDEGGGAAAEIIGRPSREGGIVQDPDPLILAISPWDP